MRARARDRTGRLLPNARSAGLGLLAICCALAPSLAARADDEVEDYGQVAAIQNREYRMGQELELAVALLPEDAFYKGVAPELSYTFHFTDSWSFEARGAYSVDFDTGLKQQLLELGTQPTAFQETRLFITGDVVWSPIYIKGTLTNRSVMHGEIYFALGGGAFEEVATGSNLGNFYPAPNLGVGIRFFLSKIWSLRLDVRDNVLIDQNFDNVLDASLGISVNFFAPE